jgi:hypothetical protein
VQVLLEEWQHNVTTPLLGGIRGPYKRANRTPLTINLRMEPGTHDQKVHGIARVLWLPGAIAVISAIHVFLIPQALLPHRGHRQFCFGDQFIERLRLPETIVAGIVGNIFPERQLIHAERLRVGPG